MPLLALVCSVLQLFHLQLFAPGIRLLTENPNFHFKNRSLNTVVVKKAGTHDLISPNIRQI